MDPAQCSLDPDVPVVPVQLPLPLNILFVNYGDFTTNSLNHIGGFANTLCAAGHACVVAVPDRKETLQHIVTPLFIRLL